VKILVTNDDGIDAPGLWVMAGELQRIGQVAVVAPHKEQSGVGSSISLRQAIEVKKIEPKLEGIEAYSVEGTPADSVIIAIKSLFPGEISLVVSGINRGPNIGRDVFVSGTVAAAVQGYLHDISSLAISVNGYENLNFEAAARLAALLAEKVKEGILPSGVLLNVNLPNLPLEKVGGMEITELSKQSYSDAVQQVEQGCYRIMRATELGDEHPGSDIWALQRNKISITPLLDSPTVNFIQHCLQDLAPAIYSELRNY
jgi:5'-nucleotidase